MTRALMGLLTALLSATISPSLAEEGVNGIDLRAKHASPLHKDIFVEMNYMRRQTAANRSASR